MMGKQKIAIYLGQDEKGRDIFTLRDEEYKSHRSLLEKVAKKRDKSMSDTVRTLLDEEAERLGIAND